MYETMLVLSVVIFIATLAIYLRHPAASIFHPLTFYLAFHGLVFVIRPIFGWYFEFSSLYLAMGFMPSLWDKVRVLICTNLGLVVFAAVSLWVAREPLTFKQDEADLAERKTLLIWFAPLAVLFCAAGLYAALWILQMRASGANFVAVDEFTGATGLTDANGYFISLPLMFAAATVMIAFLGRFRIWSLIPVAAFVFIRFAQGSRGTAVFALAVLAVLYLYDQRKRWPLLRLAIPAILAIGTFNAIQKDRGLALRQVMGFDTRYDRYANANAKERKPLESMDIAMMEPFEFLVGTIPSKTGTYDYFVSNLQLVVAPIPRALWKDKPYGAPIKMFELYRFGRALGVTFTVPGMGWYYLGYIGVVIWCAFFAWIYSYPYKLFCRSKQTNIQVIAYCIFLCTSIVSYRDGVLYTVISQIIFYIIPVTCLALMVRYGNFPDASIIRLKWSAEKIRAPTSSERPSTPHERRAAMAADQSAVTQNSPTPALETPRERRLARIKALG